MSFAYNNIAYLIEQEVKEYSELDPEKQKVLTYLCKRLYLLKSAGGSRSGKSTRQRDEFVGEITKVSKDFREE